ncbi:hypothetical protein OG777_29250 [Micromonospora peucetia]|uniref:hypothetical protein n=1 Tax=Micromonospora peucetia TaxID=47871 RepID=UPI002252E72B|nr:hypothetical protein [Micromonospora peucetia]MCX4390991.1 hypothetical protein [Micromonospora peucetia]
MSRLLPAGVALLALAAASPVAAPPSAEPATVPQIAVPAGTFRIGEQVPVVLAGWPAGTVQLDVCGNGGRRGALDCATSRAAHGQVPPSGTVSLPVVLAAPPVACPCLLRARTPTGTTRATTELRLTGVTAPPAPVPAGTPELVIAGLRATDLAGAYGWFGLPGDLSVDLTLHNTGSTDIVDPPFSLLFGRPGRVRGIVEAPALGTIGAGQTREYRILVPMDDAIVGRHELHGRIDLPGHPVAFAVEAARHPWGLLGLVAVPLMWLLARLRRRPRPTRREAVGSGRAGRRA